jgi:hypothetical protein
VHGAGHLKVMPGANGDALVSGVFGGGLDAIVQRDGGFLDVRMSPARKAGFMSWRFPWAWSRANALDWDLVLNKRLPIVLQVKAGGGQADLDLSDLCITELNLETSASSTTISFPAHTPRTKANIEASVASLSIHVPPGVAALIRTEKALSSAEIDLDRFIVVKDAHEYRTADYETAANCLEIQISLSLGSIEVS